MPFARRSSSHVRRLALICAAFVLAILSCGREATAPVASMVQFARGLSFRPVFPPALQQAGVGGSGIVDFKTVHVVLHHSDGTVALDTVITYPPGADSLTLSLTVPLLSSAPSTGEPMTLNLAYVNAAGVTVFSGGPVSLTAAPSAPGSPAPAPVNIPVTYTGPGAAATGVRISPKSGSALPGDLFTFSAVALDAGGSTVPNTPIVWNSLDPAIASVNSAAAGVVTAQPTRGTARIVAQLLTGPSDQATLQVSLRASAIAAQSGSGQTATVGVQLPQPLVVKVSASDGVGVGGVTVGFAVAAGGGSVGTASAVTDGSGVAQTTWKLGSSVGAQSVTATAAGLSGSPVTFSATGLAATPTKLVITAQPVSTSAGGTLNTIKVTAEDAANNVTLAFTGAVTIAIGNNPGAATLGGSTVVNAVAGVAPFSTLSVNRAGTGYTLVATSAGLANATTNSFDITAGSGQRLEFRSYPSGATAGVLMDQITVVARDSVGNLATGFNGAISLQAASGPTGSGLLGRTNIAAVGGVATFDSTKFNTAGTYRLSASAGGVNAVTGATLTVVPGPAAALFLASGGGQSAGAGIALPSPIVMQVSDVLGNPVTANGVTVNFAITTGGGSVAPPSAATNAQGQASTTWTLGGAAGVQTITATSAGLSPFIVSATATSVGNHLVVTQQPGPAQVAGVTVVPGFVVEARNAANALVASFAGTVTLGIGTNPGGATLSGTASVAAVGGVATFNAFSLDKSGTGYTVVAGGGTYGSVTSSAFNVTPAAATNIAVVSGNLQIATPGTLLPLPVVVKVADAFGNGVSGRAVTFAITTGGGSLGTTATTTDATGSASTTWTLGSGPGAQTITITSAGLAGSPLTASSNATGTVASTTVTPHFDTLTALTATFALAAQARDASLNPVAGTFTWVSRTPANVTVNAAGVVTAVANGSSYVVATETGGTKDSALVLVQQRLATINVVPASRNLYLGASFGFAATAVDGLGGPLAAQPAFTWSSTAPSVATVSLAGVATGTGLGSAQVRATSGAVTGVATVNVVTPITRIVVARDSAGFPTTANDVFTLAALGNRRSYKAYARDTLDNVIPGITFTWASTNGAVAGLDSINTTTVRATAAANGTTQVVASAQGVSGGATLNVQQVLTSIDLSPTAATIAVTGTTALVARGKDANGFFIPGGAFTFSSSSTANATVTAATGVVSGVANGTALITAASGAITSNISTITIGGAVPAIISFGRDTLTIGRSATNVSVPILLSKPFASPLTVNLAVQDTNAFWSTASIVIPANATSANALLNGHNAGTTNVTASDGSGAGYTSATAVLAVQATVRLTTTNYNLAVTDQLPTQVLLSDPAPAGGTYITFTFGTPGRATVSPNPAFIPVGQLAANIVVLATAAGGTTVTPAATGVNGTASTISTSAATLTNYYSPLILGAGQYYPNFSTQTPQYLYNPLAVLLTSSDTTKVTVPTGVTILANSYIGHYTVTAKSPATATVTSSASGWTSGTSSVIVTTPKLGVCCGSTYNTTQPAIGVTVYAEDSLGTYHNRTSSLAVQLSSSDTTVLRVLTPSVAIPAGSPYITTAQVIPGGAGGTAKLYATASGHRTDSTTYTMIGPKLNLSWISLVVGAGQQVPSQYIQTPNSVTGSPLVITIANTDSTILGMPPSVTIPVGTNIVYFPPLRGKSVGSVTLYASAPGFSPDTGTIVVTSPRLVLNGGSALNNFAPGQAFTTYAADSNRTVHYRTAPLIVTYTSSNPAVLTVTGADTVAAGLYYANHAQVTPVGVGSAQILASAAGHLSDSVTYTVQTPKLSFSFYSYEVGRRQYRLSTDFNVQTPNSRAVPVPVTITQKHPAVDSLSSTAPVIAANNYYAYFGFAGMSFGVDTLIASAAGYFPDTAFVTVSTPKFVTSGLPSTATTTSPLQSVTVQAMDSSGSSNYALDTVVVHAVSSNSSVIQPTAPYFRILRGTFYSQPQIAYVGSGSATMTYSDSAGSGYQPATTNSVTVTGPSLSLYNGTPVLGMRQNGTSTGAYVSTPNPVTGSPLTVNLVSTDPTVVTVPASVSIPVGQTLAYFQVSAQDVIGTIQVQATATGYGGANTSVQVTAPKFVVQSVGTANTTSPPQTITVWAEDANGNSHYTNENVTVTLASSSSVVGTIDSATVVIPAGQYYNNHARFVPGAVGTTQLSASDLRVASYKYNQGTTNVAVITPTLAFGFANTLLGIGQYDNTYVATPDLMPAGLAVNLAHFSAASSTPASAAVPAASNVANFHLGGLAAGIDSITATATGFNPVKARVSVAPGRVDPLSWPSSLSLSGGNSATLILYARDSVANVHFVTATTTFTLTPNANIQFTATCVSTTPITSVTIPADQQYVQFCVKGVSLGTGTVSITNANYTTYSPSLSVIP